MMPEVMNEKDTPRAMAWLNRIIERPAHKKVFANAPPMPAPVARSAKA